LQHTALMLDGIAHGLRIGVNTNMKSRRKDVKRINACRDMAIKTILVSIYPISSELMVCSCMRNGSMTGFLR